MKRKLTATNLIGPGAVPVDRAYVEIAPAFPFDDGSATNWDIPVRINLVNGAIPTADQPMLEDTYLGEPMTWNIRVVFEDARAKFIGGSRQVAYQLPEGTGDVDYTELIPVDVVQPPEFGPTYLQQTLEARDETVELVAEAAGAVTDAEAAASAAAATAAGIPTTNDPIVKALLDDPASQTAVELNSTFVTLAAAAKNPDLLVAGAVTGDPITSAAVVWPDGSPGTLTITERHSSGAVNAYNITYGSPVAKTFTQPTITRATSGVPTNVPQIVVS